MSSGAALLVLAIIGLILWHHLNSKAAEKEKKRRQELYDKRLQAEAEYGHATKLALERGDYTWYGFTISCKMVRKDVQWNVPMEQCIQEAIMRMATFPPEGIFAEVVVTPINKES